MTKTIFTTTLAALAILAIAPSVFAASPDPTVSFKVSTTGLDLHTSRDAQSMMRRIETAAGVLCGHAPYSNDLDATHQWKACVQRFEARAMSQLGAPMVSEVAHLPSNAQTASNGH